MTARPRIGIAERRARLGIRHLLAPGTRASSVAEAASAMVVLHASDSAGLFLQAWARMTRISPADIERELYEDRSALRVLAMRRTLFLVPLPDVPLIHAAASRAIAETERRRTHGMLAEAGVGMDPAALLEELEAVGLAAVRERGEAATAELTALDPRLRQKMTFARGKKWEGAITISQKVFFHLALDGKIGRGKPRGTWIGSQFRWSPIERWFPDGIPDLPVDGARVELIRRWLEAFGPGTRDDIKWWTGWTAAAVHKALAAIDAVEVDLDDRETGYVLANDLDPVEPPASWVALLPALDATTMGWAGRNWYLGRHRPALFDTSGNAGPTIWANGRIVGGWTQRDSGEIAPWLLEDVGRDTAQRIDAEAAGLQEWLGPVRIRWTFPTARDARSR